MTSREKISEWFDEGLQSGALWMIVRYDNFDYEDYPVFIRTANDFYLNLKTNHDRIMEVYDLKMDKELQLNEMRAYHAP